MTPPTLISKKRASRKVRRDEDEDEDASSVAGQGEHEVRPSEMRHKL